MQRRGMHGIFLVLLNMYTEDGLTDYFKCTFGTSQVRLYVKPISLRLLYRLVG